jgi:O-glycosyl hydrolase
VSQIDTHSYHGHGRNELRRLAEAAGKRLWMSEYGDGDATGLTMAKRIIKDIRELQPMAWVYWQVVDGPGWGMMVNRENGESKGFYLTEKYFVMAQFSRFIRPGDWIMNVQGENCLASYRPGTHTLNVVAVNTGESALPASLDLSAFDAARRPARAYLTNRRDRLRVENEHDWQRRVFRSVVPPHSVKTWVFSECRLGH